jgi:hypothetical protein
MAVNIELIWVFGKTEYFFKEDWTGQITLSAFNKSVFARRAFQRKFLSRKADPFTYPACRANQ